jgi:uncharacterized radical SAM superfamily Fe-S cluster-containing enzyme
MIPAAVPKYSTGTYLFHDSCQNAIIFVVLGLVKYEDAKADYEKVLELEPTNKAAKLELAKLQEKCTAAASMPQSTEEEKKPAKLDLKANISKMFASSGPVESMREREVRKNQINRQEHAATPVTETAADPRLVLPIVKPPHLR